MSWRESVAVSRVIAGQDIQRETGMLIGSEFLHLTEAAANR
jgi:hypothetical protein